MSLCRELRATTHGQGVVLGGPEVDQNQIVRRVGAARLVSVLAHVSLSVVCCPLCIVKVCSNALGNNNKSAAAAASIAGPVAQRHTDLKDRPTDRRAAAIRLGSCARTKETHRLVSRVPKAVPPVAGFKLSYSFR